MKGSDRLTIEIPSEVKNLENVVTQQRPDSTYPTDGEVKGNSPPLKDSPEKKDFYTPPLPYKLILSPFSPTEDRLAELPFEEGIVVIRSFFEYKLVPPPFPLLRLQEGQIAITYEEKKGESAKLAYSVKDPKGVIKQGTILITDLQKALTARMEARIYDQLPLDRTRVSQIREQLNPLQEKYAALQKPYTKVLTEGPPKDAKEAQHFANLYREICDIKAAITNLTNGEHYKAGDERLEKAVANEIEAAGWQSTTEEKQHKHQWQPLRTLQGHYSKSALLNDFIRSGNVAHLNSLLPEILTFTSEKRHTQSHRLYLAKKNPGQKASLKPITCSAQKVEQFDSRFDIFSKPNRTLNQDEIIQLQALLKGNIDEETLRKAPCKLLLAPTFDDQDISALGLAPGEAAYIRKNNELWYVSAQGKAQLLRREHATLSKKSTSPSNSKSKSRTTRTDSPTDITPPGTSNTEAEELIRLNDFEQHSPMGTSPLPLTPAIIIDETKPFNRSDSPLTPIAEPLALPSSESKKQPVSPPVTRAVLVRRDHSTSSSHSQPQEIEVVDSFLQFDTRLKVFSGSGRVLTPQELNEITLLSGHNHLPLSTTPPHKKQLSWQDENGVDLLVLPFKPIQRVTEHRTINTILVDLDPEKLPIRNAAYVRAGDELWYVRKNKTWVQKLLSFCGLRKTEILIGKVQDQDLARFDFHRKTTESQHRQLTENEIEMAADLSGYQHRTVWQSFLANLGNFCVGFIAAGCGISTAAAFLSLNILTGGLAIVGALILFATGTAVNWWIFKRYVAPVLIGLFGKESFLVDEEGKELSLGKKIAMGVAVLFATSVGVTFAALTYTSTLGLVAFPPLAAVLAGVTFVCLTALMLKDIADLIKKKDVFGECYKFLKNMVDTNPELAQNRDAQNNPKSHGRILGERITTVILTAIFVPLACFGLYMTMNACVPGVQAILIEKIPSAAATIANVVSLGFAFIGQIPFGIQTALQTIEKIVPPLGGAVESLVLRIRRVFNPAAVVNTNPVTTPPVIPESKNTVVVLLAEQNSGSLSNTLPLSPTPVANLQTLEEKHALSLSASHTPSPPDGVSTPNTEDKRVDHLITMSIATLADLPVPLDQKHDTPPSAPLAGKPQSLPNSTSRPQPPTTVKNEANTAGKRNQISMIDSPPDSSLLKGIKLLSVKMNAIGNGFISMMGANGGVFLRILAFICGLLNSGNAGVPAVLARKEPFKMPKLATKTKDDSELGTKTQKEKTRLSVNTVDELAASFQKKREAQETRRRADVLGLELSISTENEIQNRREHVEYAASKELKSSELNNVKKNLPPQLRKNTDPENPVLSTLLKGQPQTLPSNPFNGEQKLGQGGAQNQHDTKPTTSSKNSFSGLLTNFFSLTQPNPKQRPEQKPEQRNSEAQAIELRCLNDRCESPSPSR